MLSGQSPMWQHLLQDAALIMLSLVFLPFSTLFLVLNWLHFTHDASSSSHWAISSIRKKPPKTVLITGVGMVKGLVLGRLFAAAGDRVIGADFSSLACGRFSRSVARFYTLQKPLPGEQTSVYLKSLLEIIRSENVDLWVSCSGVASAVEDGVAKEAVEASTRCKAVQFNADTTRVLHNKDKLIDHVRSLGLTVPETHVVMDRIAIERIVFSTRHSGRRYICKCVGMDDVGREDMPVLPLQSREETIEYLGRLNISAKNPWIVQQYIFGTEYCTHALVIRGQVKVFVACPSAELLMHYVELPPGSALSQAMLRFTQVVAETGGQDFTGHLSFDFLAEETDINKPADQLTLYPIECNPRAHTAVALFNDTPEMIQAYHALLEPAIESLGGVLFPKKPPKVYWVAHDLVCLVILPCVYLMQSCVGFKAVIQGFLEFGDHLSHWRDGAWDRRDPLPWWWLYQVYWPAQFMTALWTRRKWSRINVSTTKMFMC